MQRSGGHWTDPSSAAGHHRYAFANDRLRLYVPEEDKEHLKDATRADLFERVTDDFRSAVKQSDGLLEACARQFSQNLTIFCDLAVIPVQNSDTRSELGTLVKEMYAMHEMYQDRVWERRGLQEEHLSWLKKFEANRRRLRLDDLGVAWRKELGQMLSPRTENDLEKYLVRIDRLIGLAQPGWSLQTLRTLDLFHPEDSDDQPEDADTTTAYVPSDAGGLMQGRDGVVEWSSDEESG